MLDALPQADDLIADRGYDSSWFREELKVRGIKPCIPALQSVETPYLRVHKTGSRPIADLRKEQKR